MGRASDGQGVAAVFGIGLTLLLAGCKEERTATTPELPVVRTSTAVRSDSSGDLVLAGTLDADISVAVSFRTIGTVQKVFVNEGQVVRQGQELAVLDAGFQKDQQVSAQAKLRQAEDAWNRLAPMHKNGTVPEIKWVEVETDLAQARSFASQAERSAGDAVLRAPISGILAKRSVEPGEQAPIGLPAFTIVQTGTMLAAVPVAEKDVAQLRAGMPARVTVAAAGAELSGKLREIGIEADPLTRTYKVKVAVPNPKGTLRIGMVAQVRLHVPGGTPAVVVPTAAVLSDADERRFVWSVAGGKVHRRNVRVVGFLGDAVALDSGLASGDSVVVSGTPMLADGLAVKVGN